MKEAIIGLIGVVIGALISLVGNFLSSNFQNKIWKKEKRIEHLRTKRQDLENKYEKYIEEMWSSVGKGGNFNAEMFIGAIYLFPKNVRGAISKHTALAAAKSNIETIKQSNWEIITEMKKSLAEIDKDIKEEIDN